MIENYPDHSANERTFLAWVRTVMAVVGFGLAVERVAAPVAAGLWSEAALLGSGAVVIVVAWFRMLSLRKPISSRATFDDGAVSADGFLTLLLLALMAMLAIFAIHVS